MKRLRAADGDEAVLLLLPTRPAKLPYRERVLIPEFRLNILAISDGEPSDQFCFTVGELTLLAKYLKLPDTIPPETLCSIFYFVVEFLDEKLADFLFFDTTRIIQNVDRYCAAIAAKAPGSIEGVWGFIDGTIRPICRPSKGQRVMYNGHKRIHAMKFQTVVTPDGIISHLFGPVDGRQARCLLYKLRDDHPRRKQ
ncbi:Hypothetical protein PHPALM_16924 [Phytophthora palmivora]|uniref:DDE Tnp4 domain-containing protein n=1 Tax=Phytophthora palmivora TaxID=4796 RepID=A0A2P4XNN9_9STRA|nr:Hypothetical protein PHPALM_16924 [Phytophthora palmivora]